MIANKWLRPAGKGACVPLFKLMIRQLLIRGHTSYNHPMQVHFYDDPDGGPQAKEAVRFKHLGLYMYPENRQVAVGFDITPFFEKPSIEVTITNETGERAASLIVIEAMQPNFSLIMHLRDQAPTDIYQVEAVLYYPFIDDKKLLQDSGSSDERDRQIVDKITRNLDATQEGEQ